MAAEPTFRVKVDAKRRPTLPQSLLDAAGVGPGQELIAHLDATGRIVLEGPATVLARLQDAVRAGKDAHGVTASLADELLADRGQDTSLRAAPPGVGPDDAGDLDDREARRP